MTAPFERRRPVGRSPEGAAHIVRWLLAPATFGLGLAHAQEPIFHRTNVDTAVGAAFLVAGNVTDNPRPELVLSRFGAFGFGPTGPVIPAAGAVTLYRNAEPGNAPDGQLAAWKSTPIVTEADGITLPNRPTLADVDGDGDEDVIVPGGYFFDTFAGNARGSLTWWENRGNGRRWDRHDLITDSPFSYHSAVLEDFDGDGHADIATVAEAAGNPGSAADDQVELQLLRGLGGGAFAPAVRAADGGGALIEAYDVDSDGDLDLLSPQFFGPVAGQPFVPAFARTAATASFVWFENDGGVFTRHAIGVNQGPGFTFIPVHDLRGDGITRFVATNHTNRNIAFPPFALYPEPAVYEFTPGANPRALWSVRTLSTPGSFPVTGGVGQAAPGAVAAGHLNDDDRLDLAVAGDGSRAVYWLEQQADGTFITRTFPNSAGFGQSGGPVILDLNRGGADDVVFSSFDQNTLAIWSR